MARVVLAMSGGVDSSVAADLLLRQGHEVIGVFMRHGEQSPVACKTDSRAALPILERPDHKQGCCTASDAEDGRRVADRLGIPFYSLDLQREFQQIIDYFIDEYSAGRTPNPCVQCNNWIKFGKLFEYADGLGAQYVSTGHYARIAKTETGELALLKGVDEDKDQSYVLFGIERKYLSRMLLPVGGYQKSEIRAMAAALGLLVAQKKDSQEICFVAHGKHGDFIRARRPDQTTSGEIITTEGVVVGKHEGIESYTIGQRKGLAVAMGEPYYVVRIDSQSHQVVIGPKEALAQKKVYARGANWLIDRPREAFRCSAMIRYNSRAETATCIPSSDENSTEFEVVFDEPRHGIATGQAIVCYLNERTLGGGWITSTAS
jgi:tRNA-uridine 2-sulfurtransferase